MNEKRPYKNPQYNLRIPQELKDKLTSCADENNRSLNQEIIDRLEHTLAAEEALTSAVKRLSFSQHIEEQDAPLVKYHNFTHMFLQFSDKLNNAIDDLTSYSIELDEARATIETQKEVIDRLRESGGNEESAGLLSSYASRKKTTEVLVEHLEVTENKIEQLLSHVAEVIDKNAEYLSDQIASSSKEILDKLNSTTLVEIKE